MRILLLESSPGVGTSTSQDLRADGHEVLRCHPSDGPSFPCQELQQPGSCPLVSEPAVDCAVVVHAESTEPTASEAGVSCAIRHSVPVVARSWAGPDPFRGWAVPVDGAGVVAACRTAVEVGRAKEVRPLIDEVQRLIARSGAPSVDGEVAVELRRGQGRTRVEVVLPRGAELDPNDVATRVLARYDQGRHPVGGNVVDISVRAATVPG